MVGSEVVESQRFGGTRAKLANCLEIGATYIILVIVIEGAVPDGEDMGQLLFLDKGDEDILDLL